MDSKSTLFSAGSNGGRKLKSREGSNSRGGVYHATLDTTLSHSATPGPGQYNYSSKVPGGSKYHISAKQKRDSYINTKID
jgi:hypothetical protein